MVHTKETLTPLKKIRRNKILDAAQQLFAQSGFRATTMQGIATAAGISKATVYSYFADKDEMFVAVARRFARRLAEAVRNELEIDGGSAECIARGLVAKYTMCHEVLRSSQYASELFEARSDLIGELIVEMTTEVESALFKALRDTGLTADAAHTKARILTHATQGIADNATDYDVAVSDIRKLVNALI